MPDSRLSQIIYPGSDIYSGAELSAPGTRPLLVSGDPIVRVEETAYILFQIPDLSKQKAFLEDFGMVTVAHTADRLLMRGYGSDPFFYQAERGSVARFLGAGLCVRDAEALEALAERTGRPIEQLDTPGGGRRVRLTDPDGFLVDVLHGRASVPPLATRRELLPQNTPGNKPRINSEQRAPLEPTALERFGHYVISVSDFNASFQWYHRHLGLLPTDVLCTAEGNPFLSFNRMDRGDRPADHHTVVLVQGLRPGYMHSAFETLDQDSIGQGQQFLKARGWRHFWGIGRHILGSQIFDYWLDPCGHEIEHYADGDVYDADHPTHYYLGDRGGLWAWGADVPNAVRPRPGMADLLALLRRKLRGELNTKLLAGIAKAMSRPPRPWLK